MIIEYSKILKGYLVKIHRNKYTSKMSLLSCDKNRDIAIQKAFFRLLTN